MQQSQDFKMSSTLTLLVIGAVGLILVILGLFSGAGQAEAKTVLFWEAHSAAEQNSWQDVVWSPELSKFVAVSPDGTSRVMTSADGETWATSSAAEQRGWQSVIWSPELSKFVAVADSFLSGCCNLVMTSTDGETWMSQSAAENNQWRSVTWSPELSKFVAVAFGGSGTNRVMTSTDGETWATSTAPRNDLRWQSVTWSPELSKFVAIAGDVDLETDDLVMTSTDGETWATSSASHTGNWLSVIWSPELSKFVAVASVGGANDRVMTSSDGETWTAQTATDNIQWQSVTWSPELEIFVAVAIAFSADDLVMFSTDGETWATSSAAEQNDWMSVTWSPELSKFVAVADSGTNRVMTSDSGVTLTTNTATDVATSSATLHGDVELLANLTEADVYFEYQEAGAGSFTAVGSSTVSQATSSPSFNLSGLDIGTQYEYRVVVESNGGNRASGNVVEFSTLSGIFSGNGSGSVGDPYQVTNCEELQEVDFDPSSHYILTSNIDCSDTINWNSGAGFLPIGFLTDFAGSFDGQNYTISNLFINRSSSQDVGLFGRVGSGGEVVNVGLESVDITGDGTTGVGSLIGWNDGGTVKDSYATGVVSGSVGSGGLIGVNAGSVSGSYSEVAVVGTSLYTGGLVGAVAGGSIEDSYATGNVSGTGNVGGLLGADLASALTTNSFATGAVSGGSAVGGLVGDIGSGSVSNSFWDTETSGVATSSAGMAATTAELKDIQTFTDAGWDIATGSVDPNNGYPFLAWQADSEEAVWIFPLEETLEEDTSSNRSGPGLGFRGGSSKRPSDDGQDDVGKTEEEEEEDDEGVATTTEEERVDESIQREEINRQINQLRRQLLPLLRLRVEQLLELLQQQ